MFKKFMKVVHDLFIHDRIAVNNISVIGASHKTNNLPLQDSSYSWQNGDNSFIAVSDGHGSAVHFRSQLGSKFACEASYSVLKKYFDKNGKSILNKLNQSKIEIDQYLIEIENQIIFFWNNLVSKHIDENPFNIDEKYLALTDKEKVKLKERPNVAYGCTLLVAFQTHSLSLVLKIGDGNVVVVDSENNFIEPKELDDTTNILNKTSSLCSSDYLQHFRYTVFNHSIYKPKAIFLFSDGVVNSFSSPDMLKKFSFNISKMVIENGLKSSRKQLADGLEQCSANGSGDDVSCSFIINKNKIKNLLNKIK